MEEHPFEDIVFRLRYMARPRLRTGDGLDDLHDLIVQTEGNRAADEIERLRTLPSLMPEEIEHLNQSDRCPKCGHLAVLHYEDWCAIDGCDCFIVGGPRK
jgi:hypothetical protein